MTNYMNINEFVERGFLQEVNRGFFHRLGLALEVTTDDEGNSHISGIWDYRDDLEGVLFANGILDQAKADHVKELMESKIKCRNIQPDVRGGIQQIGNYHEITKMPWKETPDNYDL